MTFIDVLAVRAAFHKNGAMRPTVMTSGPLCLRPRMRFLSKVESKSGGQYFVRAFLSDIVVVLG